MKEWIELQTEGIRLDTALAESIEDASRSEIRRWMDESRICLDGRPVRPSAKSRAGMLLEVDRPEVQTTDAVAEQIPIDVVYEDEWMLIVNKPQGMVVHPAPGHATGTLVNALLGYLGRPGLSDLNGIQRPGIVHRIDKDTSGLLIVMKDNVSHRKMAELIARHEVSRYYNAVVHGQLRETSGTVIAPLDRDPANRQRMAVVRDGKSAVTHFRVLASFARATLLELELETGRTHQIRVHMRYIGHPVLGDPVYAGGRPAYGLHGQALHAGRLVFVHPMTGETMDIQCPWPVWFETLLDGL